MSERPQIQLDINEILEDFAATNAQVTQRAIVAEAGIKARDRIIDRLATRVVELEEAEAAREALAQEEPVDPVALLDETMPRPDDGDDESFEQFQARLEAEGALAAPEGDKSDPMKRPKAKTDKRSLAERFDG